LDAKLAGTQEAARKSRMLEKTKTDVEYLQKVQDFMKQLILNEYKYLKSGRTPAVKVRSISELVLEI
jgi:hypothetical protein